MKKQIDPFNLIDSLLTSDDWDHVTYLIEEDLKYYEIEDDAELTQSIFISDFEDSIKIKLIKSGFKKEAIESQERMKAILEGLNMQGRTIKGIGNTLLKEYPSKVVKFGKDENIYWIQPEIEAALRSLVAMTELKARLMNGPLLNKEAIKTFLLSLKLIVNLVRAGNVPKLAISEAEKKDKSLTRRELKKEVMSRIIDNIFKKNPRRPKTLGEVWNKIERGNEIIPLSKNHKIYTAETGKKNGKEVVIVRGFIVKSQKDENGKDIYKDGEKPIEYKKRSLQHFIDELKKTPQEVTQ